MVSSTSDSGPQEVLDKPEKECRLEYYDARVLVGVLISKSPLSPHGLFFSHVN